MGLYSKAMSLQTKNEGKGLLKRTLEFIDTPSGTETIYNHSSNHYQKNIIDEISQQINLCKINMLPLAIVQISCNSLIHDIVAHNKTINSDKLKETIFSFIEHLLTDETKLINIGNEQYLFTLYNPQNVDPKLVVHQLSCALNYYINDISENIKINFHEKIRIYPEDGEDAEILLSSLSS
ncbi:MAG: hypothetical protein JXJ04_10090 [Spirochaetales bacterium]|nr:hypothetical protein [Spirochaetales bacterium]